MNTRAGKINRTSNINVVNNEGKALFSMHIANNWQNGKIFRNENGKRMIYLQTELNDGQCTIKHSSKDDIKSAIRISRESAHELVDLLHKIKEDKHGRDDFECLKSQIKYKTAKNESISFIENEKITNTLARLYYKRTVPFNTYRMAPELTEERLETIEKAESEVKNQRKNKLEM